ncbi:hypothetical protein CLV93_105150 [Prolixibacter denitrificans]|uniref:Uncharacterized protein n=1 Tax=Prolixibacter denitrificans TaxID=1541063 RepID=A0A2P8CCQ5_9BACT|nr:hypothetical protein CLV93_105150 [Prolixibacter denitrificans]
MINIVGMSTNPNQSMKKVFDIFMFQLLNIDLARCILPDEFVTFTIHENNL